MDLFYRLAVVYIHIPALRERQVDIEELGRHFLQKYNDMLDKKLKNISPEVIDFFWGYSWPGNVRELQHIIESAVNMASSNDESLNLEHCYIANLLGITNVPEKIVDLSSDNTQENDLLTLYGVPAKKRQSLVESSTTLESESIVNAIKESRGNIAAAARDLSISRQLLNYKIKKHNLHSLLEALRSAEKN
jgi:arginine utilization regulatory protein